MPETETEPETKLIGATATAERLDTSPNHVALLARRGELPYVKVGNRYRFRPQDIDAFITANLSTARP